jgi:hypothetical protein
MIYSLFIIFSLFSLFIIFSIIVELFFLLLFQGVITQRMELNVQTRILDQCTEGRGISKEGCT